MPRDHLYLVGIQAWGRGHSVPGAVAETLTITLLTAGTRLWDNLFCHSAVLVTKLILVTYRGPASPQKEINYYGNVA